MDGTADLNDLHYFAAVVDHGGFAAAGRALSIPKSRLSRRVAALESRLGVTLIHRSTRSFSVTEAGRMFHRHCVAMLAEAQAAEEAVARTRAEPRGTVRVSCPTLLAQMILAPMAAQFLAAHPQVSLRVEATNRRVDVIEEGFDVAIRVRPPPLEDSGLVVRKLAEHESRLAASPDLIEKLGAPETPDDLGRYPSLAMTSPGGEHAWSLTDAEGRTRRVRHAPRLVSDEMEMLRAAALAGQGVVQLPELMIGADIAAGRLVRLLADWRAPGGLAHAVFPSRRGLIPAVRLFIDALAEAFRDQAQ